MTNQEKNVPELRFPEFDGEWQEKKLGDIAIIKGRLGWKGLKNEEYVENGYAYLVAGRHIKNGIIDWHSADQINKFRYDESPEISLEKNDIIFSKDGSLGNPAIIQSMLKPATINGTMMLVRVQAQKLNPNFFYQILLNDHFKRLIHLKVSGSSIPHLFQADMKEFTIKTTKINEQQKIGGFFSKLDRQIELEEQKLAKLEEQKKGYMQKIFSQELRFKDEKGNDYPEWRKEIVGNIATTFSGGTPSSTNSNFYNGSIPFIRSGEIYKNSTELMINEQAISNSSAKIVKVGDLLYALYGATSGEVAISKINGAINQAVLCIRSQESVGYLFNYLKMKKDQILKTYIQGGQGNLSASIIKNIDIDLPDIKEQHKIGNFFNECDELIEKQNQKIDLLKERKKSFLQKMFI